MNDRYTETYDDWRERVGILPDQDVREAWEYQQEKIDELLERLNQAETPINTGGLWDED